MLLLAFNWDNVFGFPNIAIIMGCLIPISAIIVGGWVGVARQRENAALKRRMIDRGMSADEIERILQAGRGKDDE